MIERDALNEILININELPLDDADVITDISIAVIAQKFLDVARVEVLSYGWDFNSMDISLAPNTDGYIIVPTAYISTDADSMVVRDHKLYNKTTSSYIHTGSVNCQIVDDVFFDDVPFHIANYMVKLAGFNCYSNIIGDVSGMQVREKLMQLAKIEALRDNANKIDGNVLDNTFATTLLDRTSL